NGQIPTSPVARRDARGDRRRPGDLDLVDRGRAARMTTFDRIERRLPELIEELASATVPDYFDDMLRHTSRSRQRPAWSALERWLLMGVIDRSVPLRPLP